MDGKVVTMVRNFRNGEQWDVVVLKHGDIRTIQKSLREFNKEVLEESLRDACDLLASYAGIYESRTERICELAMFLASKRILDVRTVYDEFLRTKIWMTRQGYAEAPDEPEEKEEQQFRD